MQQFDWAMEKKNRQRNFTSQQRRERWWILSVSFDFGPNHLPSISHPCRFLRVWINFVWLTTFAPATKTSLMPHLIAAMPETCHSHRITFSQQGRQGSRMDTRLTLPHAPPPQYDICTYIYMAIWVPARSQPLHKHSIKYCNFWQRHMKRFLPHQNEDEVWWSGSVEVWKSGSLVVWGSGRGDNGNGNDMASPAHLVHIWHSKVIDNYGWNVNDSRIEGSQSILD